VRSSSSASNSSTAGVETSTGSWRCAFVIDATGRQRWLARALNLKIEHHGPPRVAWFNYAEGECSLIDQRNPMIASDDSGWTWMARVRPNIYQWVRLSLQGARPLNGWCPGEFVGLRSMRQRRCIDVSSSIANTTAGPGYFLAGDAASTIDPLSSHGILKALMSGMKAAHHSAAVLQRLVSPNAAGKTPITTGSRGGFVRIVPASVNSIALLAGQNVLYLSLGDPKTPLIRSDCLHTQDVIHRLPAPKDRVTPRRRAFYCLFFGIQTFVFRRREA
jgi:hypothetical protein